MAKQPIPAQSVADRVEARSYDGVVVAAGFVGADPCFALAEGGVFFGAPANGSVGDPHAGATLLTAAFLPDGLASGGDDGVVAITRPGGAAARLADENGRWIDALAVRPDGAVAWSAGKTVRARDAKGETRSLEAASGVRGLAFFPKGHRLAAAHYNGASLWFPNSQAAPEFLEWKGSHLDAEVSPDGRFVVTSMQENTLHGWRLSDGKNMRMAGYPAKTRSFAWSPDGQWLATSGAEACVIWPFQGKDGPMGRGPRECGVRPARVSRVAFHPASLVLAIGYEDGWLLLCRLTDGAEIFVRKGAGPGSKDPVTALGWDSAGRRLAFGTQGGAAGVLTLPE